MTTFVPPDFVSQVKALPSAECPYCQAFPKLPCVLHDLARRPHAAPAPAPAA